MNIIISNRSDIPIYQQLVNAVKGEIVRGALKEGEGLPSIRMLSKELSISVITTKKAYEILEESGYIKTVPGKGSFVSARSRELAEEYRVSQLEQYLLSAIDLANEMGLTQEAFHQTVDRLYDEA